MSTGSNVINIDKRKKILRFTLNTCLLLSGLAQDVIEQIIQPDKNHSPKALLSVTISLLNKTWQ